MADILQTKKEQQQYYECYERKMIVLHLDFHDAYCRCLKFYQNSICFWHRNYCFIINVVVVGVVAVVILATFYSFMFMICALSVSIQKQKQKIYHEMK